MSRGSEAPRIYFAGPNQHSLCSWLKGHRVLESFANTSHILERYRPTFQSMMLDSGVYSNMTARKAGKKDVVAIEPYCDFVLEHGRAYESVASFDDIMGGVAANLKNLRYLLDRGAKVFPTFHQGEPFSVLEDYCRDFSFIGLGFQRPIKDDVQWLDACFSLIPERVRVHGFAMTNYTEYPFWSVDSKTWLHEMLALETVTDGQAGAVLGCLTKPELLTLVLLKYQRLPKRKLWGLAAGHGIQQQLSMDGTEGEGPGESLDALVSLLDPEWKESVG